jgi:PhnB protein
MKVVPYLNFNGNCREAFEFYHQVFGGEIVAMITLGDMGMPDPGDGSNNLIMHARLAFDGQTLMASDVTDALNHGPTPVQVSVHPESVEEAERIYAMLSEGGEIVMPLEKQDWAERFAFFKDRFGVPWMINCEEGT